MNIRVDEWMMEKYSFASLSKFLQKTFTKTILGKNTQGSQTEFEGPL